MKRAVCRCWWFVILVTMLSVLSGCQRAMRQPDSAMLANPQDPGILSGKFDNGFSYQLRSTNASERRDQIDVRLIVKAGSLIEQNHERGFAHLLEHVVFRGTRRFSGQAIEALLEDAGMSWGVDVNATTHYTATVYRFSLTDSEADLLPDILALAADFLSAVNFQSPAIEREKRIVEAEWRFRYGHRNFIVDPVVNVALAGSSTGARHSQRPPIGDLSSVRRATVETLANFWQRHYTPANASLVVTGNILPWKLEQLVRDNFAALAVRYTGHDAVKILAENSQVTARVPDQHNGVQNIPFINPDLILPKVSINFISQVRAMDTLRSVHESFREELLFKALTHLLRYRLSSTPLCDSGAAHHTLLESGQTINTFEVSIADGDYLTCLQSLSLAANSILHRGFSAPEYKLVQQSFRHIAQGLANSYRNSAPAAMAERLTQTAVYGTPVLSASMLERDYLKMIDDMDLDLFNSLLRGIPEKYTVAFTAAAPGARQLPSVAQMQLATSEPDPAILKALKPQRVVLHGELKPDQLFEKLAPQKADNANASVVIGEDNYFEWQLNSGARVILVKDDRYEYLALSAISAGGYLLENSVLAEAARVLPQFVSASGVGGYLHKSLQRLQSERDLVTYVYVEPSSHGISAYSAPSDLALMLELVSAYFDEPVIIEPVSSSILRKLNRGRINHESIGLEGKFWQKYYAGKDQRLDKTVLTTDHLKAAQKQLFRSPADFTFVFVGGVDPDVMARELVRLERHVVTSDRRQSVSRRLINQTANTHSTEIRQGSSRLSIGLFHGCRTGHLRREISAYYMQLLSHIIERRVRYDLREDRGITYNIAARLLADSPVSGLRLHLIDFSVDPKDAPQAQVLVGSVLNAIGRFGVTERELQLAVKREEKRRRDLSHNYLGLASELAVESRYGASIRKRSVDVPSLDKINSIARCFSANNAALVAENPPIEKAAEPVTLR